MIEVMKDLLAIARETEQVTSILRWEFALRYVLMVNLRMSISILL